MTNEEYKQKFFEILPQVQKEEFEKLKLDYQQFEEKCHDFSKGVYEKCAEKLVELNKQYIEEYKENYSNFFSKNWYFLMF